VYGGLRTHPSQHALKFRSKIFHIALILVCVSVGGLVLQAEPDAMEHLRNANHTKANWQFTTPQRTNQTQAPIPFNLTESGD
jgi:hypothetical protein